ncbi:MAG: hypothetical protein GQ477_06060, partial [Nanohaloarchaea archaeon]|nr:hypothetical protein [Candidatus Nanohaloarchaea archaeon]
MICLDYRSNILIFCSLSVLLSLSGVVNAADFNITTLQNITDNCDYNSGTYTYNCSVDSNGDVWDNINVLTSINLLNTHGTYKADSDNIIFQAKNEFYAISTIDASGTRGGCSDNGAGGSGGSITINAKSINVTSLSSVGAYCRDLNKCRLCNTGGRGGAIYLNGVDVGVSGNLNLYGGYGTEASG